MALFSLTYVPALNANATPEAGAQLEFLQSGTTTRIPVYADAEFTTPLTNPVVANAAGKFPDIFLDTATYTYRARLLDADGAEMGYDVDPYSIPVVQSAGLFVDADTLTITVDAIYTSGYAEVGQGAARYIYDAEVDAAYVVTHPRCAFVSANGRGFRLDPQQPLIIQMFGGKADGTNDDDWGPLRDGSFGATDNSAALNAALAYLKLNRYHTTGADTYGYGSHRIHFPASEGSYDFSSTVEFRQSIHLTGDSQGQVGGGHGTYLRWRPGKHGFVFHSYSSDIDGNAISPGTGGADGSIIEGLYLAQHQTGNDFENDNYHGIYARCRVHIRECLVNNWSGDGIRVVGNSPTSNANMFRIENCTVYSCENGVFIDGGDGNAGRIDNVDASHNRAYGIWDSSFLGNTIIGCHTDANGVGTAANLYDSGSMCRYSGNLYAVIPGQAAGASTNAPSGTTADNAWWAYLQAGSAHVANPDWVSGMTWHDGGPYRVDAAAVAQSVLVGCYDEGSQGMNYLVFPCIDVGGARGNRIYGGATRISNELGVTLISTPVSARESLRVDNVEVVRSRKAALPADATDLATVITLANAIKARMKVTGGHGLVED